jgi:hypothetical protein
MSDQSYPCFYPGEFSPPTKLHLNTVHWLLSKPEVHRVNIVLGKDQPGQITQDQKDKLWDILLKSSFSPQAGVVKSKENGPISEIYSLFIKNRNMPAFIALDEKASRDKNFQKKFDDFPHYGIQIVPSQFSKSSRRIMTAIQNNDVEAVRSELPQDFTDDMVEAYMSIIRAKPDSTEEPEEKSPNLGYMSQFSEMFNDGFWKSVFQPMIETIEEPDSWGGEVNADGEEIDTKLGYIPDKQVGPHKYKGVQSDPKKLKGIARVIGKMLREDDDRNSTEYKKDIDKIYAYITQNNPEISKIATEVPGYRPVFFPKHDIVFGVISGIPPEDIKTYVEDSKGYGGEYLRNRGEMLKKGIEYISIDEAYLQELNFNVKSPGATYDWKYSGGKDNSYHFSSEDRKYIVSFIFHDTGVYERVYKTEGRHQNFAMTGEGKALKVNATVAEVTLDFMEKNNDWHTLMISPLDTKRHRLVSKFLDANIPKSKYHIDSEEGIIKITRKIPMVGFKKSTNPKLKSKPKAA